MRAYLQLLLLATAGALQQLRLKPPVRLQPAAPARFCALRMSEMEVAVTQAEAQAAAFPLRKRFRLQ